MPTNTLTHPSTTCSVAPTVARQATTTRRRQSRRLPSLTRETASSYAVEVAPASEPTSTPRCFVCGKGAEAGALEGSGHAADWVHTACLSQPVEW